MVENVAFYKTCNPCNLRDTINRSTELTIGKCYSLQLRAPSRYVLGLPTAHTFNFKIHSFPRAIVGMFTNSLPPAVRETAIIPTSGRCS